MSRRMMIPAAVKYWNSACGILTQLYICIGSAWNVSNTLFGVTSSDTGTPMTTSGAVSPIALDNARMIPVIIPGIAAGSMILETVCHLVAPIPMEASRTNPGTALIASCAATTITGMIMSASVRPAAITELSTDTCLTNYVRPTSPKTTDGTPARFEMFIVMKLVILFFGAYSSRYSAVPTDSTMATGAVTAISHIEPMMAP